MSKWWKISSQKLNPTWLNIGNIKISVIWIMLLSRSWIGRYIIKGINCIKRRRRLWLNCWSIEKLILLIGCLLSYLISWINCSLPWRYTMGIRRMRVFLKLSMKRLADLYKIMRIVWYWLRTGYQWPYRKKNRRAIIKRKNKLINTK